MNIGEVAKKSNLPAKTIRYYEDIGLITPLRDTNGYRSFRDSDMHKLAFLGRSRALGFTIEDCRNLLALWDDKDRASADVRAIAKEHLAQIESKIADLADGVDGSCSNQRRNALCCRCRKQQMRGATPCKLPQWALI
ncbi:MAG: MerR family DNA-binding protein [Sulfitobacter sp.]